MALEALKLGLIEWITNLEDEEMIGYLEMMKDANVLQDESGNDLTDEQKEGIERGLNDVDEGRVIPHDIVKRKYGL